MVEDVCKFNRPEDRVKLLKAGVSHKIIEALYIERNGLSVVSGNLCHQ